MSKFPKLSVQILLCLLMVVFGADNGRSGPVSDKARSTSDYPKTYSVPVSTKLIKIRIWLESGSWVDATQFEGGLIRISKEDQTWGLIPLINEGQNHNVEIRLFNISRVIRSRRIVGEAVKEIRRISLGEPSGSSTSDDFPIRMELAQISDSDADPKLFELPLGDPSRSQQQYCCLYCDGYYICSCMVETSCGSRCCAGQCC